MLPTQHGNADGLEVLERSWQVEERLRSGAHRDNRMVGESIEVGADVAGRPGTAVHATDPAGGEHGHPGRRGQGQRSRHGGRPALPLLCDGDGHVTLGDLSGLTQDAGVLVGVEAHASDTVEHRRDGRYGATLADGEEAAVERLGVGGRGQSQVGEDRRLECDHRAAIGQRASDVVGQDRVQHRVSLPARTLVTAST